MLSPAEWLKMADLKSRIVNVPSLCTKRCTNSQLTRIVMSTYTKKWATQRWRKSCITWGVVKSLDQTTFTHNLSITWDGTLRIGVASSFRFHLHAPQPPSKILRKANIRAILKPGKDAKVPRSYRPISLLCVPFKTLERAILSRITPYVEKNAYRTFRLVCALECQSSTKYCNCVRW